MTAKRVDANQASIVNALRKMGASVLVISDIGKGAPDIIVGIRGRNYLVEIKDGEKSASRRRLTPFEAKFHEGWKGQVTIISSVDEATGFINACLV